MTNSTKMRIHLVNYEQALGIDAILSKYARMMHRELVDLGHDVTITDQPGKADINHHINFVSYKPSGGVDTTMITHLSGDRQWSEEHRIDLALDQQKTAHGICLTHPMKEKLIKAGADMTKLSVILPAHDSLPRRPIIIAIATNLYPDGRKREEMFTNLFKSFKKDDREKYLFRIMGKGWQPILEALGKKIQVQWTDKFMTDLYLQILTTSDYLLYTGDEDSLAQSVIDATQAGLRVIAPHQFDIKVAYPFTSQEELNEIFRKLIENPVADWTWEKYAKQHETLWQRLLA